METPSKCITNRAFIKKAYHFFKYYPLTHKNPEEMLRKTLLNIEHLVEKSKSINDLTPISKEIKTMLPLTDYSSLYQEEMSDEKGRFILYRPLKFLGLERNDGKIVEIYDLVFLLPKSSNI